ncbi:MAG: hypothetical protein H5T83_10640 [Actinotalea sp.]|nr:hypothetical protein [Actinotalea sp.]
MPIYAIEYEYDSRRDVQDALRPEHRQFVRSLVDDGTVLASGPWRGGPVGDDTPPGTAAPGALLLLRAESAEAALAALDGDPFRAAGLLASRRAREWDPVVGPFA